MVLLVTQLSYSVYGQGNFQFDDYSDFVGFRAVASPAVLPTSPVQRQRDPSLARQFQGTTPGELPQVDGSSRHQVGRGEAVPQDVVQREKPRVVQILKQINEYV